jgi:hypothetical protein
MNISDNFKKRIPGGNIEFTLTETKNNYYSIYTEPTVQIVYSPPLSLRELKVKTSTGKAHLSWINPLNSLLTERTGIDINYYTINQDISNTFTVAATTTSREIDILNGVSYKFRIRAAGIGGKSEWIESSSIIHIINRPTVEYKLYSNSIEFKLNNEQECNVYIEYSTSPLFDIIKVAESEGNEVEITNLSNNVNMWFKVYHKAGEYKTAPRLIGPLMTFDRIIKPSNILIGEEDVDSFSFYLNAAIYKDHLDNLRPIMEYEVLEIKYTKLDNNVFYELGRNTFPVHLENITNLKEIESTNDTILLKGIIKNVDRNYYYTYYIKSVVNETTKSESEKMIEYFKLNTRSFSDFDVKVSPTDSSGLLVKWTGSNQAKLYIIEIGQNTTRLIDINKNVGNIDGYISIYRPDIFKLNKEYLIAVGGDNIELSVFKHIYIYDIPMEPVNGKWEYIGSVADAIKIEWSANPSGSTTKYMIELIPSKGETVRYIFENVSYAIIEALLLNVKYKGYIYGLNEYGRSKEAYYVGEFILGLPLPPVNVTYVVESISGNTEFKRLRLNIVNASFSEVLDDIDYPIKKYNIYLYNLANNLIYYAEYSITNKTGIVINDNIRGNLRMHVEALNEFGGLYSRYIKRLDSDFLYKMDVTL